MLSVHFTDREAQVLLRLANAVLDGDIHWPGEVFPRGEDAGARETGFMRPRPPRSGGADMPVISFISAKGGVGKTTTALVLACELAEAGAQVTLIDADPNQPLVAWAEKPGRPQGVSVIGWSNLDGEKGIIDIIEAEARRVPLSWSISPAPARRSPCTRSAFRTWFWSRARARIWTPTRRSRRRS